MAFLTRSIVKFILIFVDLPLWVILILIWPPAILGWSAILFKTPMFRWWFIKGAPLYRLVLRNSLIPDDVTAYREKGPGWGGKWPWEEIADKPINMQKRLLAGAREKPLIVTTASDLAVELTYIAEITPIVGYLTEYIQYDDANQVALFEAKFDNFLQGWARNIQGDKILDSPTDQVKLRREFSQFLGGPDRLHPLEKQRGAFTGNPELRTIEYPEALRRAIQTRKFLEEMGEGTEEILKRFDQMKLADKLDPNTLLIMVSAVAGVVQNVNPLVIAGLQGVDPRLAQAFFAGQREKPKK